MVEYGLVVEQLKLILEDILISLSFGSKYSSLCC